MLNSDQNIESIDLYYDDQVTQLIPNEEGVFSANIQFDSTGQKELSVVSSGSELASKQIRVIPGWISILPPLLAIIMALLLRNVIPAMIAGIWFWCSSTLSIIAIRHF